MGGADFARDQEKLEARKMLENAVESLPSATGFVRHCLFLQKHILSHSYFLP